MKILSRMLSKKIEPEKPAGLDLDEERAALDDTGRVNPSRDPLFASRTKKVTPRPEEPEIAGSGWADGGDWDDDDWDDDEDWGDEDVELDADLEARRRTQDKQHLVSEIREAMVSVSHVEPEKSEPPRSARETSDWSNDEEFGRRARARSQLTAAADETEDRILEKTETEMSSRETSRRRSAMAHMKAAAAATKADRVLQHVASRDPSGDPEEQSPYRDDLAKVVRPHSASRPISRQVSRPDAPSPVWDRGAGDDDAALYAASEDEAGADAEATVDQEMSAAEAERLARAPAELSEDDFAEENAFGARDAITSEFPSSRFAPDDDDDAAEPDATDFSHNAFGDIEDEDDVQFDDEEADDGDEEAFVPRPSRAVSEAVAFANAPDEVVEEQPEAEVRKKIWELADDATTEVESPRQPPEAPAAAMPIAEDPAMPAPTPPEPFVEVATAAIAGRAGGAGRSAGRVKTRLLGFQAEGTPNDVFADKPAAAEAPGAVGAAPVVTFPAGWIVVIDGPGRGACFTLQNGVSQIGRGEEQAVRLDFGDTSISRNNHAAVAYDDEQGKFFLGHGGKSNLVRLNGMPVLSTEEVSNGDEIRIGETTLKFVALCGEDFTWAAGKGDDASDA